MTGYERLTRADGEFGDVRFPERFQVERVVGRGGSGVVFAAFDQRLRRRVALKVVRGSSGNTEAELARHDEARTLASLTHPSLVAVYDTFLGRSHSGEPNAFLVLEYVDGPDLHQYLRGMRLTPAQVSQIAIQLCAALDYVHDRGYLHQDVKPSNVLLSFGSDGEVQAKLSDFGTAAVLQGRVQQGEFTIGTAAYLSPEQAEGDDLTAASDVYALGLVLLEAATGEVAFTGSVLEAALARLDDDPHIPTTIPSPLRDVLVGMTHRNPARRIDLRTARNQLRGAGHRSENRNPAGSSRTATAPTAALSGAAPAASQVTAGTSQFSAPQEEELTRILELAVISLAGAGAAFVEHDGHQYRHRATVSLPEIATVELRRSLQPQNPDPYALHVADDSQFAVAALTTSSPVRYLIVQLNNDKHEGPPRAATAAALVAVLDAALRLRDSVRRALFAR